MRVGRLAIAEAGLPASFLQPLKSSLASQLLHDGGMAIARHLFGIDQAVRFHSAFFTVGLRILISLWVRRGWVPILGAFIRSLLGFGAGLLNTGLIVFGGLRRTVGWPWVGCLGSIIQVHHHDSPIEGAEFARLYMGGWAQAASAGAPTDGRSGTLPRVDQAIDVQHGLFASRPPPFDSQDVISHINALSNRASSSPSPSQHR